MKFALGLFHFNPRWNLNIWSSHRHCGETLAPFLRMLACHRDWRVSIHVSGVGLEFLNKEYPCQLSLLRELIESGQVELLSALYTPSLWIAFPRQDLIKSIELNQKCLAELGLPWSRTFYAHEMFFGAGVSTLGNYFDAAICRDDYLSYYYDLDFAHSLFRVDGMKIVVASSHLLNEFLNYRADGRSILYNNHLQNIARSSPLNVPEHFPARRGTIGSVEWFWYHCGDGNHLGSIYKPDSLDNCFYDPEWANAVERQLLSYQEDGYCIESVGALTDALDYSSAKELPPLVEGAGNPNGAGGVACWMGRNDSQWENDAAILSRIARARARVIVAESLVRRYVSLVNKRRKERIAEAWHSMLQRDASNGCRVILDRQLARRHPRLLLKRMEKKLLEAWTSILQAQTSDSLGWHAGANAVEYSLQAAESALIKANQVLDEIALTNPEDVCKRLNRLLPSGSSAHKSPLPEPGLVGAEGTGGYTEISPGVAVYDCEFKAKGDRSGLKFPLSMTALVFCPSGCEDKPQRIPFEILRPCVVTLPLANGLIQLDHDIFLVKDTFHIHLAASISLMDHSVEYLIYNPSKELTYHWRFYVLSMKIEDAVNFANTVNESAPQEPV